LEKKKEKKKSKMKDRESNHLPGSGGSFQELLELRGRRDHDFKLHDFL